jgi:hypothetical protein
VNFISPSGYVEFPGGRFGRQYTAQHRPGGFIPAACKKILQRRKPENYWGLQGQDELVFLLPVFAETRQQSGKRRTATWIGR